MMIALKTESQSPVTRTLVLNVNLTSLSFALRGPGGGALHVMGITLSTQSTRERGLKDRDSLLVRTKQPDDWGTTRSLKRRWTDRPINRYFAYNVIDGDRYMP